jgi:hypothetical protein
LFEYSLVRIADLERGFYSCFSSQSLRKAGSTRSGSQRGSSLRNATVRGIGP